MPIGASTRGLYPKDWPEISRRVKEAAHWRCRRCGVRHGAWGSRDRRGRFIEVDQAAMRALGHTAVPFRRRLSRGGFVRVFEVVLATAHLDHEPSNMAPENLMALCQRCHLAHDAVQHRTNAARTRHAGMGTPDLL